MTILTHAIVAGALGARMGSPLLALAVGFFSHFLLDFLPHNDYLYFYSEKKENPYLTRTSFFFLLLTTLFLLLEFTFIGRGTVGPALLASLGSILPDALTGLTGSLKLKPNLFDKFHHRLHHQLSLAEFLHNRGNLSSKTSREKSLSQNFDLLQNSPRARVGWVFESAFEFTLLALAFGWLTF